MRCTMNSESVGTSETIQDEVSGGDSISRSVNVVQLRRRPRSRIEDDKNKGWEVTSRRGSKKLLFFEDAPDVLQFNKYIRSGYRAGFSYWDCVRSVSQVHNETGNIWSHLLPLTIWTLLLALGVITPWKFAPWAFFWSAVSICCCFTGSILYHTFMGCDCHYRGWLSLDICGIYFVLVGSQWAGMLIGFACHPRLGKASVALYYLVGALGIVSSLRAKTSKQRGLPLLALLALRIAFLSTRPTLGGASMEAFWVYAAAEVVSFVGGVVNVLRIPERWGPPPKPRTQARFDYWANSHQLMHIFVTIAMIIMHYGLAIDVKYFQNPLATCPA
ncbi:hypothetical protein BSKO_12200 [Bryopsis sp. KO-2023]|nr:hypothetical protein BSKO_12200 [Bryopsis sp. KO-2023]